VFIDSDDAEPVNESIAILHYLETYHPSPALLPPLSERRERTRALARMQESENLHHAYDALETAHFAACALSTSLTEFERVELIEAVHAELDFWEVYAARGDFIAGNTFGLADCAFYPILAYMVHRGFEWRRLVRSGREVDSWVKLREYYERVSALGFAKRAQPDGWHKPGKANVWKGTKGHSKPLYGY
jgi:glutathione S-transferase